MDQSNKEYKYKQFKSDGSIKSDIFDSNQVK